VSSRRIPPLDLVQSQHVQSGHAGSRAFLAVELERTGWTVGYSITQGLTLGRQGRILCPRQIVVALHKGEMSRESFLKLVNIDL
jgi:hypothetical protein